MVLTDTPVVGPGDPGAFWQHDGGAHRESPRGPERRPFASLFPRKFAHDLNQLRSPDGRYNPPVQSPPTPF